MNLSELATFQETSKVRGTLLLPTTCLFSINLVPTVYTALPSTGANERFYQFQATQVGPVFNVNLILEGTTHTEEYTGHE